MKCYHLLCLMFAFCLTTWAVPTIASATVREEIIIKYLESCRTNYGQMQDARIILEQTPNEEWTDAQIQTYLADVLWTVCHGMVVYKFEFNEVGVSLEDMVTLGYFPEIPGNPFSNWEPISLAQGNPGFSAGNLFILLPPPDFYSYVGDGQGNYEIKPMSFELGIFGPTIEFAATGLAKPDNNNTWAQAPNGTYFLLGSFRETVKQSDEKRLARIKYKEELAAQASKGESNE